MQVEYAFKFYVTVEGGMDFRAMLMKRKVNKAEIAKKSKLIVINVETHFLIRLSRRRLL